MGILSCYGSSYSPETQFTPIDQLFTTPSMCPDFAVS